MGRSTVINSLPEREILPADVPTCTAVVTRVTCDMQSHAELRMKDGSVRQIQVDELINYVTMLTVEKESRAAEMDETPVYYPCRFFWNGVDIVDTPGLNNNERMNRISEEIIPKPDAVIMVINPGSPFSMSEAEFVRNKLTSSDLRCLIFLLQDFKRSLDEIRRDLNRNEAERTGILQRLDEAQTRYVRIVTDLKPVCEKVGHTLREAASLCSGGKMGAVR